MPWRLREVSPTGSIIAVYYILFTTCGQTSKRKNRLAIMCCKWACAVLTWHTFGNIGKLNVTLQTAVSRGTPGKCNNMGRGWKGGCLGIFKWELPRMFCYVLGFSPPHTQKSFIDRGNKPKHIYLSASLSHSSRLNICFPGCHRVSGESCATCSVSRLRTIQGKW